MFQTQSILVVDDEANLRQSLALILQKAGYAVSTAGHASQALHCLNAGAFDLVFLDIKMPDVDGLTLLAQLRQLYPEMPVLLLTAHASLHSSIEAVRQGARDYLLKPIDPALLLTRVREILEEQRQPKRRRELIGQLQSILAELHQIDGQQGEPPSLLSTLSATSSSRFLQRAPFLVDLHARTVMVGEHFVPLAPVDFDYLVALLRHAPHTVSYEELVMQAQGYRVNRAEAQEIVRWRMHHLRQAVEPVPSQPQYIVTVRGSGYRLVVEG